MGKRDELFDITDERHFERIRNMIFVQEVFDDQDFRYAKDFLTSHMDSSTTEETCLELLPALYNRKADEYRRKAEYYAKLALQHSPDNHNNHANLSEAQQGSCGDWNLENQVLHVGRCDEAKDAIEKMSIYISASEMGDVRSDDCRIEIYRAKLLWQQGKHMESLAYMDELTKRNLENWRVWARVRHPLFTAFPCAKR